MRKKGDLWLYIKRTHWAAYKRRAPLAQSSTIDRTSQFRARYSFYLDHAHEMPAERRLLPDHIERPRVSIGEWVGSALSSLRL